MSAYFFVAAFIGSDILVWLCLITATAGCHLILRRYLPEKIGLLTAALLVVGWFALSFVTLFGSLLVYFQYNLPGVAARIPH